VVNTVSVTEAKLIAQYYLKYILFMKSIANIILENETVLLKSKRKKCYFLNVILKLRIVAHAYNTTTWEVGGGENRILSSRPA
jgi:hypothetical protein